MPKNKGAGGKGFKRRANIGSAKRNIIFKEDGQEYAQVEKMLGCGNVECRCFDNVIRLGKIRGKMLKRVWINKDDIVLVGLRDFEDDKVDIIHKYNEDEVRNLKAVGEIPDNTKEVVQDHVDSLFHDQVTKTNTEDDMSLVEFTKL
jgi:translation initiation factor 1A